MKHNLKKVLSLLTAAVLLLSAFSLFAVSAAAVPVGFSSAKVERQELSEVPDILTFTGDFSIKSYKITSGEGLLKLSELVNSGKKFETVTVYLAADLDMTGVTMQPIGNWEGDGSITAVNTNPEYYFAGTFDGQGHIINNLVMENASDNIFSVVGLFGNCMDMTVKNLIIGEGCSFSWTGTSEDPSRHPFAGAICAKLSNGEIINCWNQADVKGARMSAGIVARLNGGITFTDCTNSGDIEGGQCAGGIAGFGGGTIGFINCQNAGDISVPAEKSYGDVKGRCAAGIMARLQMGSVSIKESANGGAITGVYYAGGILGVAESSSILQNNTNYGVVDYVLPTSPDTSITPAKDYLIGIAHVAGTNVGNNDKTGETDPWTPEVLDPDYVAPPVPVNPAPDASYVGYTSSRVEKKEGMEFIPNILKFDEVKSNEYKITTPEGLVKLGDLVKSETVDFTGLTIYLANDLDMSSIENFEPIGGGSSKTACFNGVFDGQGNVIENLTVDSKADGFNVGENLNMVYIGLFAVLADATVKNLIIGENCTFTYSNDEINSPLTPDKCKKEPYVGAIAGAIEKGAGEGVIIDNCWNRATVTNTSPVQDNRWHSAGIVSHVAGNKNVIRNTTNSGTITDYVCAAGFSSMVAGQLLIENCRNTGTVTMTNNQGNAWFTAAGFIARVASDNMAAIKGCINNGTVVGPKNMGAFYGTMMRNGQVLLNCTNYGTYSSATNVGLVAQIVANNGYYDANNLVTITVTESVDKAGETDPTLLPTETVVLDFTPVADLEKPVETDPVEEESSTSPEDDTTAPDEKDTNVTTKPAETTAAADQETNAPASKDESGCGSAVGGGICILAVAGAAVMIAKKKRR